MFAGTCDKPAEPPRLSLGCRKVFQPLGSCPLARVHTECLAERLFLPSTSILDTSFLLYRNSTSQPSLIPSTRLQVPLSKCGSSPSTVSQSKLPSRPELLAEFWRSSAPRSLTEEDFPPKRIPAHGQHRKPGTHQLQQAGDYNEGQRPQAHGASWRDLRSCTPSPASRASPLRIESQRRLGPSGRWAERPAGAARAGGGVGAPGASFE